MNDLADKHNTAQYDLGRSLTIEIAKRLGVTHPTDGSGRVVSRAMTQPGADGSMGIRVVVEFHSGYRRSTVDRIEIRTNDYSNSKRRWISVKQNRAVDWKAFDAKCAELQAIALKRAHGRAESDRATAARAVRRDEQIDKMRAVMSRLDLPGAVTTATGEAFRYGTEWIKFGPETTAKVEVGRGSGTAKLEISLEADQMEKVLQFIASM